MSEQLRFLRADALRVVNSRRWRWMSIPWSHSFAIVAMYRLDRGCYLVFGPRWRAIRILLLPLLALVRPWAGSEINYRADIGPGLLILHASLGVVVSAHTTAGTRLTLAGGNVIGTRPNPDGSPGSVIIGDQVEFGVHSCVLGPVHVGSQVRVGAHAVVLEDVENDTTVVGIPARRVR